MGGGTYQEHERGEEEEPKVICLPVRERGFFEHPTVTHAAAVSNFAIDCAIKNTLTRKTYEI